MKKLFLFAAVLLILTGCKNQESYIQRGMDIRDRVTQKRCAFTACITADYGQSSYTFVMECRSGDSGDLSFVVKVPEAISDISGRLTADSGFLTFDDVALAFPLLADGEISPVSAPWIFLNTLRNGYLVAAGEDGVLYRLTLRDSYEDDALHVDVWIDEDNIPQRAEILWQGRSVLSLHIEEFVFV